MENEMYLIQKTLEMTSDFTCCDEVKTAAQSWLSARGTENEAAAFAAYLEVLRDCVQPIQAVLEFSGSPEAAKAFGEQYAKGLHAHYLEVQAEGGRYCDCPACSAARKILEAAGTPLRSE